ncbi:anti restriction protein [Zymobacter palmae]|uniref:Anti restriction protein n=1 Tax=Zymobacter palmae TaxID=33074 RepID=A0A348HBU4_9GAMM|nr:anti restriction protein [Zymobacter palmae]
MTKGPPQGSPFMCRSYQLFNDLGNNTSTYGAATFTDCETQTIFHCDRSDQRNFHGDVIARHYHFNAFRQFTSTSYVSGTEVELRTIAFEERSVTTAFVFRQDVHFRVELGVRSDSTRLSQNLTTFDFVTFGTTQQRTNVLTCTTFVEQFAEHFNTSNGSFGGFAQTNDFDFFTSLNDTALYTTGNNGTTTRDREYVFDRHQERLINGTFRFRDVLIQGLDQVTNSGSTHTVVVFTFQRHQCRTDDDRSVVTREVVFVQKFANFHFDQLEQLFVIDHVRFVQEHNDVRNANLTRQQDVLTSLRHGAVSCRTYQDRAVHLRSTSDHVLDVVSVSRAVNVRVVTDFGLILNVSSRDSDTTFTLFRSVIDGIECTPVTTEELGGNASQGRCQRRFTMVDVADGTNVDMRFGTIKFFLSHCYNLFLY